MNRSKPTVVKKDYSDCKILDTNLRVYRDGRIERILVTGNQLIIARPRADGYCRVSINGKFFMYHRIVYYAWNQNWNINNPKLILDHIDGNRSNNQLSNLRPATHGQNAANSKTKTGRKYDLPNNIVPQYKGSSNVWYWRISACVNGKRHCQFIKGGNGPIPNPLPPLPQIVIDVRNDFVKDHHGDFATIV